MNLEDFKICFFYKGIFILFNLCVLKVLGVEWEDWYLLLLVLGFLVLVGC